MSTSHVYTSFLLTTLFFGKCDCLDILFHLQGGSKNTTPRVMHICTCKESVISVLKSFVYLFCS